VPGSPAFPVSQRSSVRWQGGPGRAAFVRIIPLCSSTPGPAAGVGLHDN
jgi:hypothetical protein